MMADETPRQPDPEVGTYADFGSRFCARIIDLAVLSAVSYALWGLCYAAALLWPVPPELLLTMSTLGGLVYLAYFTVMTARSGQTFGKRYMGIQVQSGEGVAPGFGVSFWRAAVDMLSAHLVRYLVGLIDYLWYYRRRDRRTLHDLVAGTSVRVVRAYPKATGRVVLLAVLVTMLVNAPFFVTINVRQTLENMSPTIARGENVQVNRLAYRHRALSVGEVVQFKAPLGFRETRPIGRVVGRTGDYLALRNGVVERVSGRIVPEAVLVPAGSVAVLGDNRTTPEAGGYPRWPFPPAGPRPQTAASSSPIVVLPSGDIVGQVTGVTWPPWRLRVVR